MTRVELQGPDIATLGGSQSNPLLTVSDLSIDYYQNRLWTNVIDRVSFTVRRGESFGLVGESGSGKTTVLRSLIGYRHPASRISGGQVIFDGSDLIAATDKELRKGIRGRRISYVPQDPSTSLTPTMRVGNQILEPLLVHKIVDTKAAAHERMLELLHRVRIPEPEISATKFPHQLSGGQQQRVAIAMALAANPELLLLDEPTTGLDVTTQSRILELLVDLQSQLNLAIVYVTHNLAVIASICDRVGVMYAGELVEIAPTIELFQRPRHPYTRGLMASVPRLDGKSDIRFEPLKGMLLRSELPAQGCRFAPRCEYAKDSCFTMNQELEHTDEGNLVACRRWADPELSLDDTKPKLSTSQSQRVRSGAGSGDVKLTVRGMSVAYQYERGRYLVNRGEPKPVLRNVSFDIMRGETLGLVGESGSGKTTIAKALIGLQPLHEGEIAMDGSPISPYVKRRSREELRQIQLIMQNPDASLNPRHRTVDLVGRSLQMFHGTPKREIHERVADLLLDVKLDHTYLNRFPMQMSGGERQRVAIARAIAAEPDLVLCDEIASALDVSVQAEVLDLLKALQSERGLAFLFITHDLAVVRSLAHRVIVLYGGEMLEEGLVEEVFTPPTHPYTHVLLSAVPDVDPNKSIRNVEGMTTDLIVDATGKSACAFAGSCPWKLGEICDEEEPPQRHVSESNTVRCHIPLDELADREKLFHESLSGAGGGMSSPNVSPA